ncbi:MAG: hypothetical protein FGM54_09645 [Chitinophagaceae bacterium]|nr:hypothetical protein [Chitinophagaceae bacterium]
MLIKQSTKDQYELLQLPEGLFNTAIADELSDKCRQCRASGRSVIIDASSIEAIEGDNLHAIAQWQMDAYEANTSWVMAGLKTNLQFIPDDMEINYTPTLDEAIDIVAMEIIEREFLNDDF